jgi:DnaJ-class molecular chaperone
MMQVKSRAEEITYRCPECGGRGRMPGGQASGDPRVTSVETVESECPLCHGSGRVTAHELADYYYLGELD